MNLCLGKVCCSIMSNKLECPQEKILLWMPIYICSALTCLPCLASEWEHRHCKIEAENCGGLLCKISGCYCSLSHNL